MLGGELIMLWQVKPVPLLKNARVHPTVFGLTTAVSIELSIELYQIKYSKKNKAQNTVFLKILTTRNTIMSNTNSKDTYPQLFTPVSFTLSFRLCILCVGPERASRNLERVERKHSSQLPLDTP